MAAVKTNKNRRELNFIPKLLSRAKKFASRNSEFKIYLCASGFYLIGE